MELNSTGPKKFKVSILLKKKSKINEDKKTLDKINIKCKLNDNKIKKRKYILKHINSQKKFNCSFHNNNSILDIHKSLPKNISNLIYYKKLIESEPFRNMEVQTTLSSLNIKKKFRTPYQILQLKNKMLKSKFEYSKIIHQNFFLEKEINNKIINIKPYNTKNINKKYENFLSTPKLDTLKAFDNKYKKIFIIKKTIKKNRILTPSRTFFSDKKILNKNNNKINFLFSNENETDLYNGQNKF